MTMTPKQRQRQDSEYRARGKYAKVNPCYRCGKSAGIDYCSDHRTDTDIGDRAIGDQALCLCDPCGTYMANLTDDQFLAEIDREDYGHLPQGKTA